MKLQEASKSYLLLLLLLACFVLDLITPLGVAVWVFYLVPLGLSSRMPWRWTPVVVAGISTILIGVGVFLSPEGVAIRVAITNRMFCIALLWVTVVFFTSRKSER